MGNCSWMQRNHMIPTRAWCKKTSNSPYSQPCFTTLIHSPLSQPLFTVLIHIASTSLLQRHLERQRVSVLFHSAMKWVPRRHPTRQRERRGGRISEMQIRFNLIISFLDAFSHLYKRVYPSVRPSVRPSVGPSVRRSHTSWNHAKVPFFTKTTISTR